MKFIKHLLLATLIYTQAYAGLPPTTSRGISDTSNKTTFNFQFPSLVQTRTGATTSFSPPESGSYTKNYITGGNAESNSTTGWTTYDDGAATPTDGTGGSPVISIAASNSSPLAGTYSYLGSKGNATSWYGNGYSYDFTIDSADQAKVLQIQFSYALTGSFTLASDSSTGTWTVWIYDVTNGQLIQPSTYTLKGGGLYIGNFQTASNSTSYRLIVHNSIVAQLSPGTIKLDTVTVSPSTYAYGTPITDWQSYTPTFTGLGTVTTITTKYRRVGDTLQIRGNFTLGTVAASLASISIPSGLSIDTNKLSGATTNQFVGTAITDLATVNATKGATILASPSNSSLLLYMGLQDYAATGSALTPKNGNAIFVTGSIVSIEVNVPIQGWSSSVQTSDQADSRNLVEQYNGNGGTSITANVTNIDFTTKIVDTHGAWSGTVFTANSSGFYDVKGLVAITGAASPSLYLYKNGSSSLRVTSNEGVSTTAKTFNGSIYLNGGDTLSLRSDVGVTLTNSTSHWISISRSPTSQTISATETVAASYWLSANQTTSVQINFDSKEYDTHGAVTTGVGAWKFTAPVSGLYSVFSTAYATTTQNYFLFKNGSNYKFLSYVLSTSNPLAGVSLVRLNAGDYIDIRPGASATVTGGLLSAATTNRIEIIRVGN